MRRGHPPTYNLGEVQALVAKRAYRVTIAAFEGAAALYLDESDIVECICDLTLEDFDKTMPSETRPGTFQDVYLPRFHGFELYVKLQAAGGRRVVVISFKKNESA